MTIPAMVGAKSGIGLVKMLDEKSQLKTDPTLTEPRLQSQFQSQPNKWPRPWLFCGATTIGKKNKNY